MDQMRRWFNKPRKDVGNQPITRPSTSEMRLKASPDSAVAMETLNSTHQLLESLLMDIRDPSGGSVGQMGESHPDQVVTARLTLLRDFLQNQIMSGHLSHLQSVAPPPDQLNQITGGRTHLDALISPVVGRASHTCCSDIISLSVGSSLPSSPHPGWRREPPRSLPCSPLLRGRRRSFSRSSPAPPPLLSRQWLEAALQRSRKTPPPSRVDRGQTKPKVDGTGPWDRWTDWEEKEEEEEEVDPGWWCLDSESSRYCLVTPCTCTRCPSAPPYHHQDFVSEDLHPLYHLRTEDWRADYSQTGGDSEQSLDHTPQLGPGSKLYPSLSQWRISGDSQTEVSSESSDSPQHTCMDGAEPETALQPPFL